MIRSAPHPCNECLLSDFVPADAQSDEVPCHHIPLNAEGETVYTMERQRVQIEMEEAVKAWLRQTIQRIEQERATKTPARGRDAGFLSFPPRNL